MIVNENGIQKEDIETMKQKLIDIFVQNQQNINTASTSPAMNLIDAIIQQRSDCQDNIIAMINQLGSGACGDFLDLQAMYLGLKRNGGDNTIIVFQVIATGAGTIDKDNFIVVDKDGNNYVPENETIFEQAGTKNVNFVAEETGAIKPASLNSVEIKTPLSFISEVHNFLEPDHVGSDGESDLDFRLRKQKSDSTQSRGMKKSVDSQIAALDGVIGCKSYENATDTVDANGLEPYTFYLIVDGGEVSDIANVLAKNIGLNRMKGNVHYVVDNETMSFDRTNTITFFATFKVKLFNETLTDKIKENIATKIAELAISNNTFPVAESINASQIHDLAIQALEALNLEGAVFDSKIGLTEETMTEDFLKTTLLNDKFALSANNVKIVNYDE